MLVTSDSNCMHVEFSDGLKLLARGYLQNLRTLILPLPNVLLNDSCGIKKVLDGWSRDLFVAEIANKDQRFVGKSGSWVIF